MSAVDSISTLDHETTVPIDEVAAVLRTIYENRYFTNHGPLAREFEARLERYLEIEHVVTVGSDWLALLVALAGLQVSQELVLPADCSTAGGVAKWLRLKCAYYDIDLSSDQATLQAIKAAMTPQTDAVVLADRPGTQARGPLLDFLSSLPLNVVMIAPDCFAAGGKEIRVVRHPRVVTVHSFGTGQTVTTLQGGAISTCDPQLAHRFRNIRSSYGVREAVRVKATCNGRFSELQAGLGIRCLDRLE